MYEVHSYGERAIEELIEDDEYLFIGKSPFIPLFQRGKIVPLFGKVGSTLV
jgi:hypothetical protein